MANKVRFGLSNLHIAFKATTGWETPQKIEGVVGFSPEPQGDSVEFYADNTLYYNATSNNGYTADLECALIPDSILAEMLGNEYDATAGVYLEVADGEQKEFALIGQIDGDQRNRRFVYYSCKASRGKEEHKTTEKSKEPATETVSVTISPTIVGTRKLTKAVMELNETNTEAFNSFFDSVYVKPAA